MARMPEAEWLGEHSPRTPMSGYDVVCVHTIVGFAPAHAAHFSVKGNGHIQQSRDTAYRSAANLYGNHRVIAIENEDHGPDFPTWSGSNVPPLTDAQVEANAKILRWAHETHGIPLQLCPDSRPGSRGLGYHRLGIDGNFTDGYDGRVSGGEVWTSAYGKACPGKNRIDQIPRILELARGGATQEDDMPNYRDWTKADKKALAEDVARVTVNKLLRHDLLGGKQELRVSQALRQGSHADDVRRAVEALEAAIEKAEGGDASPRP